ncbi:enoyl-CoA hydratase/isomerase family protein [Pseudonocardia pini]|uniref:enoyl-CoA hydratase/isomerase family protein n=1 Tax=Pseudonocardia pini TaxID=2758030 RepID=UPI0015F0F716|nr:enoyl-CoA hydratase/isomerase family protein [Pseudonocardia pini]
MSVSTDLVGTSGTVAVVTMRWPGKRNSLSPEDGDALTAAITAAGADPSVTGLVLTGEGAFCSGGDLRAFAELSRTTPSDEVHLTVYGRMQAIVRALRDCPVPTVAAVDGPAIGLGLDLALACDMRFVGPRGYLMQGWARAGLVHGVGGVPLLERVAPGLLWRLVAEQEKLGPVECAALDLGEVGEPDALTAATTRIEKLAPVARDVLAHYVTLSRMASWPAEEQFEAAGRIQGGLIGSQRFRDLTEQVLGADAGRS